MKKIVVIGTGAMGSGIIQTAVKSGFEVVFNDIDQKFVDGCTAKITKAFDKLVAKEKMTEDEKNGILAKMSGSTDISIVADCDLVIEAATENADAKKAIFKNLDEICKPETILASNTSSLSITDIASATNRPEKVIGMHFFNPVPVMKLVEVIRGLRTDDATNDAIFETSKAMGKVPVAVDEAPGFAVNRILVPMMNEAVGLLADGVASAEDIDTAMKLGAGHPMGPLALLDMVGIDIALAVMEVLYTEYGDPKYRPHILMKKMVRGGKLGMKTGEGFFSYK